MAENAADFKSQDRSVRKQRIIDAATQVFHLKGYRAATLDDVAQELGVTKAALYHYFSSKEALLTTIYMQAIESALDNARRIEKLDLSPPQKLRSFIKSHVKNVIIDNLSAFVVFFSEENQLPTDDLEKIRRAKKVYNRVVEGLLEEGMAQGYFHRADAKFQANAILGMCNSLHRWHRPERDPDPDRTAELFIALLERGYLKPPPVAGRSPERTAAWKEELKREQERHHEALSALLKEY